MIVDAWTVVAERLPTAKTRIDNGGLRLLAVEMMGLAFGVLAQLPEEGRSRLPGLIETLNGHRQAIDTVTLRDIFVEELDRVLSALAELDPDYAGHLLERQLAGPWQSIATAARASLIKRLAELRAAKPPLAERLAIAPSYEAFAVLLRAHAGNLPRFMPLCYCLAARSATDMERQERLAKAMAKHRACGLHLNAGLPIDQPKPIGSIIDYLADPRTEAVIRAALRSDQAEDDEDDYVYLDSFDRSSSEIQTIVEIILKGGLSRTRPGL
jgi:hypothetical protein